MVEQETPGFAIKILGSITTFENVDRVVEVLFPGFRIERNDHLRMDEEYLKWVKQGRKTTTIRYAEGAIRIPASEKIALIESRRGDSEYRNPVGFLIIKGLEVKRFSQLTEEDAKHDGFDSRESLLEGLQAIYDQEIGDDEPVSIFKFRFEPKEVE